MSKQQRLQLLETIGRDTVVRSTKRETLNGILDKGEDAYADKNNNERKRGFSAKGYLVPTKAALFGLDVRFRHID